MSSAIKWSNLARRRRIVVSWLDCGFTQQKGSRKKMDKQQAKNVPEWSIVRLADGRHGVIANKHYKRGKALVKITEAFGVEIASTVEVEVIVGPAMGMREYMQIKYGESVTVSSNFWQQSANQRSLHDGARGSALLLNSSGVPCQTAATTSGLYNCQVCGLEKCSAPGICADCLTPPTSTEEKAYSTRALIERLNNALENGYEGLGETDIGDLLLESELKTPCPHCNASPCLGEFDSSDC